MKIAIAKALFTTLLISVPAAKGFCQLAVTDPPVESATAATASELGTTNATLAQIATSDALIAASVTTPCDAGLYQGVSQYLDGLDALLTAAGVSSAAMVGMFPGFVALFPVEIPADVIISGVGLAAYEAAVQVAQTQALDFDPENIYLAAIEAQNVGATGLLCAQQMGNEATLALAAQLQMLRQLLVTQITVEGFHNGEELNERAQQGATEAQVWTGGIPQ